MDPNEYITAISLQQLYDEEKNITEVKDEDLKIIKVQESSDSILQEDLDYAIALSLVESVDGKEESKSDETIALSMQAEYENSQKCVLENFWDPKQIVDKSWELVDPHPNIYELFVHFDTMFFKSTLVNAGVAIKWGPRMTLCAGLCCYEGRGGLCCIRLSEPLLKLRPRKDLVETLLHEMIHAYLFVTANNKDRDGHGPEFISHMKRINTATGAKITVFHSFHDEVNLYRQHWWKCNGPCKHRPPFYGTVRRAMNRAPSSKDRWWSEHEATCGGSFIKIKEPEGYTNKKKTKKEERKGYGNIAKMFKKGGKSKNSEAKVKKVVSDKEQLIAKDTSTVPSPMAGDSTFLQRSSTIDLTEDSLETPEQKETKLGMLAAVDSAASTPSYDEIRTNMLQAALKRLDANQQKGKLRDLSSTETNTRESLKRTREVSSDDDDDLVVINKKPNIDESIINIDTTASRIDYKECPVCGRGDIPSTTINIHINFCLEEMELDFSDDENNI